MIRLARARTRQPQGAAKIDWGNPLNRDLVFAFDAASGKRDLVSGARGGAVGAGVSRSVGANGLKYDFSGSQSSGAFDFGVHHGMDGAKGCTFDILIYFNAANPNAHFFGQWDGVYQEFLLQANGSGGLVWVPADGPGAGLARTRFDGSGLFAAAGLYRIIAAWRGGTDITVLVNGVDKTASFSTISSAASAVGSDNTSDLLQLGTVAGGSALNGSIYFARAWRAGKSKAECRLLATNPYLIHPRRKLLIGVTVQIARPVADLSNTGWVPSTGTDLYPMIGETVRDDATFIAATFPGALYECTLSSIGDPNVSTDHSLPPLVLSAPGGGGITVRLRQGTTTIASWTYHPGPTPTEYTPTLSGAEADSITDYTALRLQFEAIV